MQKTCYSLLLLPRESGRLRDPLADDASADGIRVGRHSVFRWRQTLNLDDHENQKNDIIGEVRVKI